MRSNFIYGPYVYPNIPLGISNIKAFIEENSHHKMRCFDLNIEWHHKVTQDIQSGIGNFGLGKGLRERFLKAQDLFQNSENDLFYSQNAYNQHASTFLSLWSSMHNMAIDDCKKSIFEGDRVPAHISLWYERILEGAPDVVGFSILFLPQLWFALIAARLIRQTGRDIKIVFGGGFFNRMELTEGELTNWIFNSVDYVISYEGELPFLALLDALEGGKSLEPVPNLSYMQGGKLVQNISSDSVLPEEIPYADYSDFDIDRYYYPEPALFVVTSRGCYWRKCAFCDLHSAHTHKYRMIPAHRVVDELAHHQQVNGVRFFYFIDEMINPKHFVKVCQEIIRRGLDIRFTVRAKPTAAFTHQTLEILYQAGCRIMMWGSESGSQRILDLMDKGVKVAEMEQVLRDADGAGIKNHIYLMVGFPGETMEDVKMTCAFLFRNRERIYYIHGGNFQPIRGARIYDESKEFGLENIQDIPNSNGFSYNVSTGIGFQEKDKIYQYLKEYYFKHFAWFSNCFGKLRIHSLMIYSHPDKVKINAETAQGKAEKIKAFYDYLRTKDEQFISEFTPAASQKDKRSVRKRNELEPH